jgi:hypothetical protein
LMNLKGVGFGFSGGYKTAWIPAIIAQPWNYNSHSQNQSLKIMKLQSLSYTLWVGPLLMSTAALSTPIGPQKSTQHQATAELSGAGWKRLFESLNSTETDENLDPIVVQCVLQYFVLGSSCGEFRTSSRILIARSDAYWIMHRSGYCLHYSTFRASFFMPLAWAPVCEILRLKLTRLSNSMLQFGQLAYSPIIYLRD